MTRRWMAAAQLTVSERAFSRDDQLAAIRGYVEVSGEGRWTVEEAMRLDVPAPVITLSLRHEFGGHAVQTK